METPEPAPWTAPDPGAPYAQNSPHGNPPPPPEDTPPGRPPADRPYGVGGPRPQQGPYGVGTPQWPYPGHPQPMPYGYGFGQGYAPVRREWSAPPEPGARYYQLARNAYYAWWRPVVGSLFVIVCALGLLLALGVAGMLAYATQHDGRLPLLKGDSFFGNANADLAFELLTLAVLLPTVLLAALVTQRRRPGTVSSVAGRLRWGWLMRCCGLALVFLAVSFGWSYAVTALFTHDPLEWPKWSGWRGFVTPAIIIVTLVPLQSAAEEYIFRGWLIQAMGSWIPARWKGRASTTLTVTPILLVSAAAFTAGHGYTGWAMVDTYVFGVVAGFLAVRTGGLESGIALHAFNNLYAFLLPAAAGQVADSLHQGSAPWQDFLSDAVPLVLYAIAVLLLARRRRLATTAD